MFSAEGQGADAVDTVFVEERGAFCVHLVIGTQEGKARRKGEVKVDFVAELAGESEEGDWHG